MFKKKGGDSPVQERPVSSPRLLRKIPLLSKSKQDNGTNSPKTPRKTKTVKAKNNTYKQRITNKVFVGNNSNADCFVNYPWEGEIYLQNLFWEDVKGPLEASTRKLVSQKINLINTKNKSITEISNEQNSLKKQFKQVFGEEFFADPILLESVGDRLIDISCGSDFITVLNSSGEVFMHVHPSMHVSVGASKNLEKKNKREMFFFPVRLTESVTQVSSGREFTFALTGFSFLFNLKLIVTHKILTEKNNIYCWGINSKSENGIIGENAEIVGQLGNYERPFESIPSQVIFPNTVEVEQIACGAFHSGLNR